MSLTRDNRLGVRLYSLGIIPLVASGVCSFCSLLNGESKGLFSDPRRESLAVLCSVSCRLVFV